MRIAGVQTSPSARPTRRKQAGSGTKAAFTTESASAESVQQVRATSSIDPFHGLIAAQEIDDENESNRRAKARGEFLLERLDELRNALLVGRIPPNQLSRLYTAIRDRREAASDPELQAILAEIELRAAVELAKMKHAPAT